MNKTGNLRELRKKIKKVQDAKRYEHTLGVEYTAAALAMCHGESVADARLAGILHDCAKCLSDTKNLAVCEKHGIPVTEVERRNPYLLHSKVGAYLAEKKYGVKNQDVLNAILYHTTGRQAMSPLEKIIFIADYIEPGRKQAPNLEEIRQLAFRDLDEALIKILEDTLEYLRSKEGETDSRTEITLQYYKNEKEQRVYGEQ